MSTEAETLAALEPAQLARLVAAVGDLAWLPEDAVELLWGRLPDSDDAGRALVLADLDTRDRRDRARRHRHQVDVARYALVRETWELAAHADFIAAEEACNGVLLSRCADGRCPGEYEDGCCPHGIRPVRDPYPNLWRGNRDRVAPLISEEMEEFWGGPGLPRRPPMISEVQEQFKRSTNRDQFYDELDAIERDRARYDSEGDT